MYMYYVHACRILTKTFMAISRKRGYSADAMAMSRLSDRSCAAFSFASSFTVTSVRDWSCVVLCV